MYHGPERRRRRLADWRMVAAFGWVLLVLLVFYAVISAGKARDQAFTSLQTSRAAATRRIDLLTAQIQRLQESADRNGSLIGQLQAQIEALRQQLIKAGITPVVPAPSRTSSSSSSSSGPRPAPSPTSTSHPSPRPRPSPTRTPSPSPSPTCVLIIFCP